ncbi:MAG: hypothetical protein PVG71_04025 [Anaerolineae bacterium]
MNKPIAESGSFLTSLALVLALAGLVVVAVLLIPRRESATMRPTVTPAETKIDVPLIDANAPPRTKTATFAMG